MPLPRRPASYWIADQSCVMVPAEVAAWLEEQTDLPRRRVALRGNDPAVDEVLIALRYLAAQQWADTGSAPGTGAGTSLAPVSEPGAPLERAHLGVASAAALIGITDRAVRRAIHENRLPAQQIDGRWVIDRTDALNYTPRTAA